MLTRFRAEARRQGWAGGDEGGRPRLFAFGEEVAVGEANCPRGYSGSAEVRLPGGIDLESGRGVDPGVLLGWTGFGRQPEPGLGR